MSELAAIHYQTVYADGPIEWGELRMYGCLDCGAELSKIAAGWHHCTDAFTTLRGPYTLNEFRSRFYICSPRTDTKPDGEI